METQRSAEQREDVAEQQADNREADDWAALLAAQLTMLMVALAPVPPAVVSPASNVFAWALKSNPSFTGTANKDYNNYTSNFYGKVGQQGYSIQPAFFSS